MYNSKRHKTLRRELRSNMPEPERRLWKHLRAKQLGVNFRRQQGIGRYIVDFYSRAGKLVIELDGDSHFLDKAVKLDIERDRFIEKLGIRVLRFTNIQIMEEIESVLEVICDVLKEGE
ncbi:endonuclease domain-containing protein [Enterovibrio baiacu]|uniref:endonuclease domain-containing protein n=1 Tax=Enterovibrio baiacu TaxID=2491023 RepID=UPI001012290F|nr:endonuclease domain-containing protein [Enterovibrio baiacu]MBE1274980.1 endonuclease domain-containing protein [Enterovibrio baiacu]